jgi:hypothetical protein
MLPLAWRLPRALARAMLVRGVVVWAGLHAAALFYSRIGRQFLPAPDIPIPGIPFVGALWVVALAAALGELDSRRRNEHLLLANLGVGPLVPLTFHAAVATIGEIAVAASVA